MTKNSKFTPSSKINLKLAKETLKNELEFDKKNLENFDLFSRFFVNFEFNFEVFRTFEFFVNGR